MRPHFPWASSSPADPIKTTFFSLFFCFFPPKEIIDYLYEKKLPELEEMLESRKGKPDSSDNSTATNQKKAFRLRDIFDSSEDSE